MSLNYHTDAFVAGALHQTPLGAISAFADRLAGFGKKVDKGKGREGKKVEGAEYRLSLIHISEPTRPY